MDKNSRSDINKINAELKLAYAHLKRERWKEMCIKIDARSSNSKLWKLVKSINKEHDQFELSNSVGDTAGQTYPSDKSAADVLVVHYQSSSRLPPKLNRPVVIPIKNSKKTCSPKDFRCIDLTCITCKLMEKRILWIPSHVKLYGNEIGDELAKEGRNLPTPSTSILTYLELYSLKKSQNLGEWRVPPTHHWYRPGLAIALKCVTDASTLHSLVLPVHQVPLIFSKQ
ncbi:RNase H domain-containing protein [Trichonephila clavipes]|nr:RNase H domain-containing protein [Trichonephila clavipes]